MSELSPQSRALFRAGRASLSPTDEDRARVDRALVGIGVIAGVAGVAKAGGALSAVGKGSTLALGKWLVALAVVGSAAAGSAAWIVTRAPEPVVVPQAPLAVTVMVPAPTTPASVTRVTTEPTAPVDPIAVVAPAAPIAPRPPKSAVEARAAIPETPAPVAAAPEPVAPVVAQTPAGSVAAETRLLRQANAALQSGDAARALALLDEHAKTFPSGTLVQERRAEHILVLCKLGRTSEAQSEASRFTRASPDSPLAERIRSSCAGK